MPIHNTERLRKRADWHAKQDHIIQGTYGRGNVNGDYEFKGCAIGCLATPHGHSELIEYLRANLVEGSGLRFVSLTSTSLTYTIEDEFGIHPDLMRQAEDIFEALEHHGAAIEFIPQFAHALVEGSDFDYHDVMEWQDGLTQEQMDSAELRRDSFLEFLRNAPVVATA